MRWRRGVGASRSTPWAAGDATIGYYLKLSPLKTTLLPQDGRALCCNSLFQVVSRKTYSRRLYDLYAVWVPSILRSLGIDEFCWNLGIGNRFLLVDSQPYSKPDWRLERALKIREQPRVGMARLRLATRLKADPRRTTSIYTYTKILLVRILISWDSIWVEYKKGSLTIQ